jgi:hypothetical protein
MQWGSDNKPMSSTNEMACKAECLSSSYWNRALTDRMKSTGDIGKLCSKPAWIAQVSPVLLSITSMARRLNRNESTQRTILPAMLTCIIRLSRYVVNPIERASDVEQ